MFPSVSLWLSGFRCCLNLDLWLECAVVFCAGLFVVFDCWYCHNKPNYVAETNQLLSLQPLPAFLFKFTMCRVPVTVSLVPPQCMVPAGGSEDGWWAAAGAQQGRLLVVRRRHHFGKSILRVKYPSA